MGSTLTLCVPRGFDLPRAVCSYGYFLLAPNAWLRDTQALRRPLRGEADRLIFTLMSQRPARGDRLRVACDSAVSRPERAMLAAQVTRMLRLDEDPARLRAWFRAYPEARRAKFGRLFRSPTLFEDVVKTITGCNVTWSSTMKMNRLLCARVGGGGFPTPAELAAVKPETLRRECLVGYRAERIIRLAKTVAEGELDLAWFEDPGRSTDEVFRGLKAIYGLGDYAAGNLCQLLGRYERLAIDTETYRHFEQEHGLDRGENPKAIHPHIERHYARYAPFQFLAYWFDLWRGYQRHFGPSWRWDAEKDGPNFTATRIKALAQEAARRSASAPPLRKSGRLPGAGAGSSTKTSPARGSRRSPALARSSTRSKGAARRHQSSRR